MMKYHPLSQTIVQPFNEGAFPEEELYSLIVITPDIQAGDTMIAKIPVRVGDGYVLEYDILTAGSVEQIAYFERR